MKRSPRRPLILKRRKLPFHQSDTPAAESHAEAPKEATQTPTTSQDIPDGIRIMDHPSMSDVQVVVIPQMANLQSVIGALSARGKECGAQGPNKFILLGASGNLDGISSESLCGHLLKEEALNTQHDQQPPFDTTIAHKQFDLSPLNENQSGLSLLGQMVSSAAGQDLASSEKENQDSSTQAPQAGKEVVSERPPYSYMAMIQFAINSSKSGRMTLKEIYTWMEDHFPYFRKGAKPGWKNSIRHNLSLHDMFTRETLADGKVSHWTIRPEANRCLTLDQEYKPGCDPTVVPVPASNLFSSHQQHHRRATLDAQNPQTGSLEKKMKPLLPRAESYLVPVQLPLSSPVYLTSSSSAAQVPLADTQKRRRVTKRVRIAPKVETKVTEPNTYIEQQVPPKVAMKEETQGVAVSRAPTRASSRRQASTSRRKQSLAQTACDEPVILYPENSLFDSGISCSSPSFQEPQRAKVGDQHEGQHPPQERCFKTPIKSGSVLASSTPCKPHAELLRVTPMGKNTQNILDFSPIRTPNGPMVTPQRQFLTPVSYCSTPFEDYKIFSSPGDAQAPCQPVATDQSESPDAKRRRGSCSRVLLQAGGATPTNRSVTEGLVLDTMNDSLSKILVDLNFSGVDDEELGLANISWSDLIPQLK